MTPEDRGLSGAPAAGPLGGLRLAVKDVVAVAGRPCRAGSATRRAAPPEAASAPIVEALLAGGARLVGTTRLHELAFGATGINRFEGTVTNPADPRRIAGGSSSGSAAAVALDLADVAIATDTGGSARIPAALCGVVGFKAGRRLAMTGVLPLAPTLDHLGWCTSGVAATVRAAVAAGLVDTDTLPAPPRRRLAMPAQALSGSDPEVQQAVAAAVEVIRGDGVAVSEVDWPHDALAHAVSTTIMFAEASRAHVAALDAAQDLGDDVRARLERGLTVTAAAYLAALTLRDHLTGAFARLLEGFDAVATPTVPVAAPPLLEADRPEMAVALVRHTRLANLTGLPAVSLPLPVGPGALPLGLQLTAGDEAALLGTAQAVEAALRAARPGSGHL